MPHRLRSVAVLASAFLFVSFPATAPSQDPDKPAAPAQAPALPFSFSGVMYLNYQYGGAAGKRSDNKFDLARAYLNFRAATGNRDSIRVTLDVYQQTDTARDEYYRGWTMRVKYGYLQHDLVPGTANQTRVFLRLGLIQTVMVEKEEQYWNRGLSQVAVEQAGYFNSADGGVAAGVSLPNKVGEIYMTITNGNGYGSRETDRFKDFQARLTLTPWANGSGPLKGLQVSPWASLGGRASDYASRKGTVLPVAEAQEKNRYGLLLTYRNAGMALGGNFARKADVKESADTTADVAPAATNVTGNLTSLFGIIRPAMFASGARSSPWSIVLRADEIQPDNTNKGIQRRYIVGSTWDLSSRTSVTFDVQSLTYSAGLAGSASRIYYLHLISNF